MQLTKQQTHSEATCNLKKLREQFEDVNLRPWQHVVLKIIKIQNDRVILFIIDELGNQGKTWLAQYITLTKNGQSFDSTNKEDVAYTLNPEKETFIFDITRATEPNMSLQILESIKNGMVFSGKYERGQRTTRSTAKHQQIHDTETTHRSKGSWLRTHILRQHAKQ